MKNFFRECREACGYSLRQAERHSGVSNAYISQLETGKVKNPSPVILEKLSRTYGIPYYKLMRAAGYPFKVNLVHDPITFFESHMDEEYPAIAIVLAGGAEIVLNAKDIDLLATFVSSERKRLANRW